MGLEASKGRNEQVVPNLWFLNTECTDFSFKGDLKLKSIDLKDNTKKDNSKDNSKEQNDDKKNKNENENENKASYFVNYVQVITDVSFMNKYIPNYENETFCNIILNFESSELIQWERLFHQVNQYIYTCLIQPHILGYVQMQCFQKENLNYLCGFLLAFLIWYRKSTFLNERNSLFKLFPNIEILNPNFMSQPKESSAVFQFINQFDKKKNKRENQLENLVFALTVYSKKLEQSRNIFYNSFPISNDTINHKNHHKNTIPRLDF